MLSLSSSLIEQVNTKFEAYRLVHDPTRLITLLFSKYGDIEEDLNIFYTNQLLYNLHSKFNCIYKENIYSSITRDYLKRLYRHDEAIVRLPKLNEYYKNYHLFFCRPTLRHRWFGKIMCNYQDKKAEVFYKDNYKESKENISNEKNNKKEDNNSNSSMTSLDNITNNKTIFDKYTKKMLEKSETEIKNNNYYNTLILETSRSNLLNNGLISKRADGEKSFEKCINALMDYQFLGNKNKNKNNNIKKKIKKDFLKNNKQIKKIFNNSNKFSKIKYISSQSQRSSCKLCDFKMKKYNSKILNSQKRKINSSNSSINNKNYITRINSKTNSKNNKNSLYILTGTCSTNRYSTSTNALLKKKKRKINHLKELNLNQHLITTSNKDLKKNKNYFYSNIITNTINKTGNNSKTDLNVFSTNNIYSNANIIKNLKLGNDNSKKLSKLSEYLKHFKNKDSNF